MTRGRASFNGTRAEVEQFFRDLPTHLSGRRRSKNPRVDAAVQRILRAMAAKVFELFQRAYRTRSEGGTDEAGLRWKPLAPSTVAARRRNASGRRALILRDTDTLYRSFTPIAAPGRAGGAPMAPFRVVRFKPGSIEIDSDCPYAAFHHLGTRKMPARPLWPEAKNWPSSWWLEILRAMTDELAAVIREGRLK